MAITSGATVKDGAGNVLLKPMDAGSTYAQPPIPPHDYQAFTYIASGAADNDDVATIVFKQGGASGTTVATLTYTYVGSTNNVSTITLT